MSRITIRSYNSDGPHYVNAEIVWNPSDPDFKPISVTRDVVDGGIASVTVIPSSDIDGYITVEIFPDDVPEADVFSLPINLVDPLRPLLVGAQLPSIYYSTPYAISALPDTPLGFRLAAGVQPTKG
ncbi:MAG TPA: hypothetical protein VIM71_08470 [Lacunisphaera sp.]